MGFRIKVTKIIKKMEFLEYILSANLHIDFWIVLLVIASGYFQKMYLSEWKLSQALKTLVIGTTFSLVYLALTLDLTSLDSVRNGLLCVFISYALATSFYELIVKPFEEWLVGILDRFKK